MTDEERFRVQANRAFPCPSQLTERSDEQYGTIQAQISRNDEKLTQWSLSDEHDVRNVDIVSGQQISCSVKTLQKFVQQESSNIV